MYYVYILQLSNGQHYVGSTPDLKRRVSEHEHGNAESTKNLRPLRLVWYGGFEDRLVALRFEKYLKSGSGTAFRHKHLEKLLHTSPPIREYHMREIERTIVAALIFSKYGKLLMGKKDPAKVGVYPDCWHIPGGGIDEGKTLEQALHREIQEEVGIYISPYHPVLIPEKGHGTAEKTLPTGEKVLCHMEFNRFRVDVNDKGADEIELHPSSDLVETRWFSIDELPNVKQIPGGKEFFQEIGLIPKE